MSLQVQSPACPWEYYISEELHYRLVQSKIDINIVSTIMSTALDIIKIMIWKHWP